MYIHTHFYILIILFFSVSTIPDPQFVDEIGNITVPAGRNVKLACSVKDLGSFKVCNMNSSYSYNLFIFAKYVFLTFTNLIIFVNL